MHEILMVQAAAAHLGLALRLLDKLDADVSAAHLMAAIEALKEDVAARPSFQQFINDRDGSFVEIDALVDDLFGTVELQGGTMVVK